MIVSLHRTPLVALRHHLLLLLLVVVLGVLAPFPAHARPHYPDRLPNGRASGDPSSGLTCLFLGHNNCVPGAPRNQFGLDFAAAGRRWTVDLCMKDSDGDGLTNGQELGDPCCTWAQGPASSSRTKLRTTQLSHPGDASSVNSAPETCPAASTPSTSPPPPVPSTCGEAFKLPSNVETQLRCQNVAKLKSDSRVAVVVSVRNGRFYLSAKVKKRVRKKVRISGYAFAVDTKVQRIDAAILPATTLGKPSTKVKKLLEPPINDMAVPTGKSVCCGKGTATVAVRMVLSPRNPMDGTASTMMDAVLEKRVKVRCTAICKPGETGSPMEMGTNQRCPACK